MSGMGLAGGRVQGGERRAMDEWMSAGEMGESLPGWVGGGGDSRRGEERRSAGMHWVRGGERGALEEGWEKSRGGEH